jgi:hypothetical protein
VGKGVNAVAGVGVSVGAVVGPVIFTGVSGLCPKYIRKEINRIPKIVRRNSLILADIKKEYHDGVRI